MKKKFITTPNWLLCLIITLPLLAGMLSGFAPLNFFELKIYDLLSQLRQREMPSPVAIIEIDRESMDAIGPWPWPRSLMADMINVVSEAKAKAIGIDILYKSKIRNPALEEINDLLRSLGKIADRGGNTGEADAILAAAARKIDDDSLLISAVKPAQNVVLALNFGWSPQKSEPQEIPGWLKKNTLDRKPVSYKPQQLLKGFRNPLLAFRPYDPPQTSETPFRALAAVASRYGHTNHAPDPDGVTRRESLLINYRDQLFPSLALQMALAYRDHKLPEVELVSNYEIVKALRFGNQRVPLSHDLKMFIDYNENPFTISRYSFSEVLAGKIPKGVLEDKLVLIGVTDPAFTKTYRTPTGIDKAGVEIAAETVENIVNQSFIQRPGWAWFLESMVLLYFGIILLYITDRLNAGLSLTIMATFLFCWWGLAAFMFINNGFWFYIAPHTLAVILGFSMQRLKHYQAAPEQKVEEQTEMNKMLGLSFQAQGLLDMAFDSFRKCSLNNPAVKEAIYNLALDFERKRMFNKAVSVYEYLLKGGKHKDAHDRIWRLRRAETKTMGGTPANGDRFENTLIYNNDTKTRPTLGRYEVLKEIGKGAIGTVYLGRDPKINRKVAIKTLRYDELDEKQLAELKERFFREAEAAGRLSHPNIVTIYDAGEDYDITYMAMEYLDGHDLTRHCKKNNLLPVKVVLNIIIRVAFALDYAHKHKVIHRDIKPANVMLTEKGHVKVTDFGIARLTTADSTQTGVILGTPNYMSPEQVLGKKLDGRSDIFSLGAVLYELLTGEKPFKSTNIGNLMHNIASAKFQPVTELRPDTPPCCDAIVRRMMTKSRTKRFSNAGEVVIEAQKCMGDL
ncbi:MAG: CHASE2 domain-containing protein [Desulfurivibrionaceae bacterium]